MKTSILLLAFVTMVFTGCSTPKAVTQLRGRGTKQVYDAGFDRVWNASVAAAQQGYLEIVSVDKTRGYIATRRPFETDSFGENIGIWVRSISPHQTQVEVVSRPVGPPVFELSSGELRILNSISADLTTTATAGL